MLEVCCAVIYSPLRKAVLIAKRKDTLLYEFPGGKLKPSESYEDCIYREIQEEFQLNFRIISKLPDLTFQHNSISIKLIPFLGNLESSDKIVLNDHLSIKWLSLQSGIEDIDWQSKNYEIFKSLKAFLDE